jgi:hypothetical protein
LNLFPLGKASDPPRHGRQCWSEWTEIPSLRDLNDLGILAILTLSGPTLLEITFIYQRNDVVTVLLVTFVVVFYICIIVVSVDRLDRVALKDTVLTNSFH